MHGKYIDVPIVEITYPYPGLVVVGPKWWTSRKPDTVLIYQDGKYIFPQCNNDKYIVEYLNKDCIPVFIPISYWPQEDEGKYALKKWGIGS